jgi:hypothetical protein
MNKKTALTVAAFALPLVVLVALAVRVPSKQPEPKKLAPVAEKARDQISPKERLEKRIQERASRLAVLKKMTQKDWDEEGVRMGEQAKNRAPNLQEAIKRNEEMLKRLSSMTPEQHEEMLKKSQPQKKPNATPAPDKAATAPKDAATEPKTAAPAPATEPAKKN